MRPDCSSLYLRRGGAEDRSETTGYKNEGKNEGEKEHRSRSHTESEDCARSWRATRCDLSGSSGRRRRRSFSGCGRRWGANGGGRAAGGGSSGGCGSSRCITCRSSSPLFLTRSRPVTTLLRLLVTRLVLRHVTSHHTNTLTTARHVCVPAHHHISQSATVVHVPDS
jgi:hypothetical protein